MQASSSYLNSTYGKMLHQEEGVPVIEEITGTPSFRY